MVLEACAGGALQGFFVRTEPLAWDAPAPVDYALGLYGCKVDRDGWVLAGEPVEGSPKDPHATHSLTWINDLRKNRLSPWTHGVFFDWISARTYLTHEPMYGAGEDFRVLDGYVFPRNALTRARNPRIAEAVRQLYDLRCASADTAEKEVYKLLLNGAYGKTLQKPVGYQCVVADELTGLSDLLRHRTGEVRSITPLFQQTVPRQFLVEMATPFRNVFGRPHIGAEILSAARALMNRVSCLLPGIHPRSWPLRVVQNSVAVRELPRGTPAYTDTDSFHVYARDWQEVVMPAFRQTWGFDPVGSALLQFHSDFPSPDDDGGQNGEVVGCDAIYGGKKMYCIPLRRWSGGANGIPRVVMAASGGSRRSHFHVSLKGIPEAAMRWVVERAGALEDVRSAVFLPLLTGSVLSFPLDATEAGSGARRPHFALMRRWTGLSIVNLPQGLHRHVRVRGPQYLDPW